MSEARLAAIDNHLDRMDKRAERIEEQVTELLIAWRARVAVEREREPTRLALAGLPARVAALESEPDEHNVIRPLPTAPQSTGSPAIIQVMNHRLFTWAFGAVLAAIVLTALAVAGGLTWKDVEDRVPRITMESHTSHPSHSGGVQGPAPSP